ncbi:lipopolysaccharide assembly protein LapA domain-containing protein [Microbulbifer sp. 2201CG32-9]|uniref:lipopolysaccharide assembly protein LapA domain-containing protein n=1 Tax=Microbulbifer sp. 2201CG32-9 TaxID=3232309 RepID=UPI00345B78CE
MSFLHWLLRLCYGLLALFCVVIGVYFSVDNPQSITPTLAGYALPTGSVGFWLIGFLLLGALLGVLAGLPPFYVERRRVHRLERQLRRSEKESHMARRTASGD